MSNARTLVAVPYLGEFGWELMNWQGRVRCLAATGGYERVYVCAPEDRRHLYASSPTPPALVFVPTHPLCLPGTANEDHRLEDRHPVAPVFLRELAEAAARRACEDAEVDIDGAEFLAPDYSSGLWPTTRRHQMFADLRVSSPLTMDVILIPRQRPLAPERNQAGDWWDDLAGRLARRGVTVAMYHPDLGAAVAQLSQARLAAGASTGGIHLASLCRCPHYVWGSGPEARWTRWGMTNRQRYETIWNPFGTPCRYDESGWRPSLNHVEEQILRSLDDIGLVRGNRIPSWSLNPHWRIRRSLARVAWPWSPLGSVMPWRMRRLVQEHMV